MFQKRTKSLIGIENTKTLNSKKVAVFGIGGVGSFVAEALVRAGIGKVLLVDSDGIDISNINRQLFALHSTVGKPKVEVAKERLLDINPNLSIQTKQISFCKETAPKFDFSKFDYVVDAIDMVTSKILLVQMCKICGTPIICSLGTGNKLETDFIVSDISKTSVCPLARVLRREFKKRDIQNVKVVWSKEEPKKPQNQTEQGRPTPASISFVPSSAGLKIASEVVKDLISTNGENL